ncbi:DUF5362 family protein [Blastopirellula marina]|uniref:Uncharacterized protein n=1 Tax=Blastopirellula marina DSM 3645 TaxID=314230 RepID=A3ZMQ4_9BACT|nr:DUF5362 family protein [Blastopirellula marina]EAQ82230.1 hypothetical protein DSM3645_00910 [Blastopirellula marina DSM 3645]
MQPNRSADLSSPTAPEPCSIDEESHEHFRHIRPLVRLISKANLIAILLILLGGIYCVSIVGLVIGWAPIRLGLQIRKLTQQFDDAFQAKDAICTQTLLAEIDRLVRIGDLVLKTLTVIAIAAVCVACWLSA